VADKHTIDVPVANTNVTLVIGQDPKYPDDPTKTTGYIAVQGHVTDHDGSDLPYLVVVTDRKWKPIVRPYVIYVSRDGSWRQGWRQLCSHVGKIRRSECDSLGEMRSCVCKIHRSIGTSRACPFRPRAGVGINGTSNSRHRTRAARTFPDTGHRACQRGANPAADRLAGSSLGRAFEARGQGAPESPQ
jgi:hypothetical protein